MFLQIPIFLHQFLILFLLFHQFTSCFRFVFSIAFSNPWDREVFDHFEVLVMLVSLVDVERISQYIRAGPQNLVVAALGFFVRFVVDEIFLQHQNYFLDFFRGLCLGLLLFVLFSQHGWYCLMNKLQFLDFLFLLLSNFFLVTRPFKSFFD